MTEQCSACRFWKKMELGRYNADELPDANVPDGRCRRHAPHSTALVILGRAKEGITASLEAYPPTHPEQGGGGLEVTSELFGDVGVYDAMAVFPTTSAEDWCGEFDARLKEVKA